GCRDRSSLILLDGGPEGARESVAGAAEVLFDGALAGAEGGGDLGERHVVDEAQGGGLGLAVREVPDRRPELLALFAELHRWLPPAGQLGGGAELDHPATELRDGEVRAGPSYPQVGSLELGDVPPAAVGHEHRLLGDVLSHG